MNEPRERIALSHVRVAVIALGLIAAFVMGNWFRLNLMPPLDFSGYVASVDQTQRWLSNANQIPVWCAECFGGSSLFGSRLKEVLSAPFVWVSDPVIGTQLAFVAFRWIGALGMPSFFVRLFRAPYVGAAAGFVYSFGSLSNHEIAHLEIALLAALLPMFLPAVCETLRGYSRAAPIILGVIAAMTFSSTWIQALVALILAGLVLVARPWGPSLFGAQLRGRRIAVAITVAFLLSASPLALKQASYKSEAFVHWSTRTPRHPGSPQMPIV